MPKAAYWDCSLVRRRPTRSCMGRTSSDGSTDLDASWEEEKKALRQTCRTRWSYSGSAGEGRRSWQKEPEHPSADIRASVRALLYVHGGMEIVKGSVGPNASTGNWRDGSLAEAAVPAVADYVSIRVSGELVRFSWRLSFVDRRRPRSRLALLRPERERESSLKS